MERVSVLLDRRCIAGEGGHFSRNMHTNITSVQCPLLLKNRAEKALVCYNDVIKGNIEAGAAGISTKEKI